ncbi:ubiquinone biosynthesis protein COQ9, mitochondrial-like isoform X2 [Ruditapes philippinarum]|uniref:ubiquinone biosynthesis protein COQ9, mitochondrial-like isoform X2 n=1 Tax=Ruditapes philippinarum TaxID=129788 RepID=UPI00295B358C|nr:ubiquinone biosynthesis protein COQ9, mitochondrial-like isoform X2 [Ruditapes philippinarum]
MAASMTAKTFSCKLLQNFVRCHLRGASCRMMSQESTGNGTGYTPDRNVDNGGQETEYEIRQRILKSSLPFVLSEGWTQNAIAAGAEAEGLPGVAHGLFPRGGVELVYYFYTDCNKRLAEQLAEQVKQEKEQSEQNEEKPSGPKITPFIRGAVETRLRMITPYMDKWPQAMAMLALPPNAPEAFSNLLNFTDEIWYYAGDSSTDFNWYTKRLTLAGVYKATEVFMVQDKSEDFDDTWQFLDRRMDDLKKFGNITRSGQQSGAVVTEACKGIFIMARNVLGANSRA